MYARRNSLIKSLKKIGLGLAIASAPFLAPAANAQFDSSPNYRFSDTQVQSTLPQRQLISPTLATPASQPTPIIKSVHQFALDSQGVLSGQISTGAQSPAGLSVFIVANKNVVGQTTIGRAGEFQISGIVPGRYSLFVAGNNRFAAKGIAVTGPVSDGIANPLKLTTVSTKYKGIQKLMGNTLLPQILEATRSNTTQVSAIISNQPIADRVRIINGRIRGQISSLIAERNAASVQVYLVQDGEPVSQVETNALGSFVFPDVEPGTYDFVAVGSTGFAAIRFEAVGNRSPMTTISYQADVASALQVPLAEDASQAVAPVADTPMDYQTSNEVMMEPAFANDQTAPVEYASESIACGCAGGGSAGSYGNFSNFGAGRMGGGRFGGRFGGFNGGGIGGGGLGGGRLVNGAGFGRLLTLGAISGSIVAIADDDDPAPASPVR